MKVNTQKTIPSFTGLLLFCECIHLCKKYERLEKIKNDNDFKKFIENKNERERSKL